MAYRIAFEWRVIFFKTMQYNVGLPRSKRALGKNHESHLLSEFKLLENGRTRYGYGPLHLGVVDDRAIA